MIGNGFIPACHASWKTYIVKGIYMVLLEVYWPMSSSNSTFNRYAIAILSNQNGLNNAMKIKSFKRKISSILSQVDQQIDY